MNRKWYQSPVVVKLATWMGFGVLVALVPFLITYLFLLGQGGKVGLPEIFGNGQMLLVSGAIAAGALGEAIPGGEQGGRLLIKCGAIAGCILSIFVSAGWFGSISSAASNRRPDTVANLSLILFGIAFVCSLTCIVIAAIRVSATEETRRQPQLASIVRQTHDDEEEL